MTHTENEVGTHPLEGDLVEQYIAGRLPEGQARDFEAHYFACDECWTAVRRAAELRATFSELPEPAGDVGQWRARPQRLGWRWRPLMAAAVAVLALGTWHFTRNGAGSEPVLRSPVAALAVGLDARDDVVTAAWAPVPGADVYQVRLVTIDGGVRMQAETADTSWVVTRAALHAPGSADARFLEVRAVDALRQPLARSPLLEIDPTAADP